MLKDLIIKNRSCRGYDSSYVMSREDLLELVDAARLSGSTTNRQQIRFYIADDKELVEKILPLTRWGGLFKDRHLPYEGKRPSAFIVVCVDKTVCPPAYSEEWAPFDIGIACQSMLLTATEKGLAGLMIGNVKFDELKALLQLPEELEPRLVVAFGKPDEEIKIVDVPADGNVNYYRDENDVHYVPKRALKDLIINY